MRKIILNLLDPLGPLKTGFEFLGNYQIYPGNKTYFIKNTFEDPRSFFDGSK